MIIKQRNLQEQYRFNLKIELLTGYGQSQWIARFLKTDNTPMNSWNEKLTPSQWIKAKKYLTRNLVPFAGYTYEVKPEYQKEAIYKII